MKVIPRNKITDVHFAEILKMESHHDHQIILDVAGTIRWQPNENVRHIIDRVGLNDVMRLLMLMGYDKNSEVYRKLYRDLGYSLDGYWEVFYWYVNNDKADEYQPPKK